MHRMEWGVVILAYQLVQWGLVRVLVSNQRPEGMAHQQLAGNNPYLVGSRGPCSSEPFQLWPCIKASPCRRCFESAQLSQFPIRPAFSTHTINRYSTIVSNGLLSDKCINMSSNLCLRITMHGLLLSFLCRPSSLPCQVFGVRQQQRLQWLWVYHYSRN